MTLLTEETALKLIEELKLTRTFLAYTPKSQTYENKDAKLLNLKNDIIVHIQSYWNTYREPIGLETLNRSFARRASGLSFSIGSICSDPAVSLLTAKSGKRSFCPSIHVDEALQKGDYTGLSDIQAAEMSTIEKNILADYEKSKNA